jgi:hypothetical protein
MFRVLGIYIQKGIFTRKPTLIFYQPKQDHFMHAKFGNRKVFVGPKFGIPRF